MKPAERVVLAAAAVLYLISANSAYLGHYVDDIVWVLLARSFIHGSAMAAWSYFPHVETNATWGFPLMLTPVLAIFGAKALALKIWCSLLLLSGTFLLYASLRDRLTPAARLVFAAGLFFNNFYLAFSGNVTSESAYMLLFGVLIYLAFNREWLTAGARSRVWTLGLLTSWLILTRVIGGAFLIAAAIELAMSKRPRRAAELCAAAAIGAAPYFLISKLASGTVTFHNVGWAMLGQLGPATAVRVFADNLYFYLKGLSLLTFAYCPAFVPNVFWLKLPLTILIAAIACVGAVRDVRSSQGRVLAAYFLIFFGVCIAWPYQGPRFVFPVFPLFFFWFVLGLFSCIKGGPLHSAAAIVLILATNFSGIKEIVAQSLSQAPDMPHESFLWLKGHSAPDDLIVSMEIARINYYSGRRGMHFIPSDSPAEFVKKARDLKATYFLLKGAAYVPTALNTPDPIQIEQNKLSEYLHHAEYFTPVYDNPAEDVRIWTLRP